MNRNQYANSKRFTIKNPSVVQAGELWLSPGISDFLIAPRKSKKFIALSDSYRDFSEGKSLYQSINDRLASYDDPHPYHSANTSHESGGMPHVLNLNGFLRNYDVFTSDLYRSFNNSVDSFYHTLSGQELIIFEHRLQSHGASYHKLQESFGYTFQEIQKVEESLTLAFGNFLQKGSPDAPSLALRELFNSKANTQILEDRFRWLIHQTKNLRTDNQAVPWYGHTPHNTLLRSQRNQRTMISKSISREALDSFEESVVPFLSKLSYRDRDIFQKRFLARPSISYEELGELHGVHSGTIVNIETNLVGELVVSLLFKGNPKLKPLFTDIYQHRHTVPLEQSLRNFISYMDGERIKEINETLSNIRGLDDSSVVVSRTPKIKETERGITDG